MLSAQNFGAYQMVNGHGRLAHRFHGDAAQRDALQARAREPL